MHNNLSPVQKFHLCRTGTLLPTTDLLLNLEVASNIPEHIQLCRQRAKSYYDKEARPLPPLEIGETVRMQPLDKSGSWKKGSVVKKVRSRTVLSS